MVIKKHLTSTNPPSRNDPRRIIKHSDKTNHNLREHGKSTKPKKNIFQVNTLADDPQRIKLSTQGRPVSRTDPGYGNGRENNPTSTIMDQFASGKLAPHHSTIEDNDSILASLVGSDSNDDSDDSDSDHEKSDCGEGQTALSSISPLVSSKLRSNGSFQKNVDGLDSKDTKSSPIQNRASPNSIDLASSYSIMFNKKSSEFPLNSTQISTAKYDNEQLLPLDYNKKREQDLKSDIPPNHNTQTYDDDDEGSDFEWEDIVIEAEKSAVDPQLEKHASAGYNAIQGIDITLDKRLLSNQVTEPQNRVTDKIRGVSRGGGISKQDRQIRLFTHNLHLQCLMYHGFRRNKWLNYPPLHSRLKKKGIPKSLRKKCKQFWKHYHKYQNNTKEDPRAPQKLKALDPQFVTLLIQLVFYFMKRFKVTHHGLRSYGYIQNQKMKSFGKDWTLRYQNDEDQETYKNRESFTENALKFKGSRDTGAQIFTALLRSLSFETRLVFSLPVITHAFGKETFINRNNMTKYTPERYTGPSGKQSDMKKSSGDIDGRTINSDSSDKDNGNFTDAPPVKSLIDSDILYPIFWCEVYNPITGRFIPVDPLVLGHINIYNAVDHAEKFEPKGKFRPSGMDMKYVVAYENDGNTRNVTGRYLSSYVDKLTPPTRRQQRDTNSINSFMFFKRLMKLYTDSEKHTENLQREDEELARIMERTKRESNMENGRFSNKVAAYKNHEKFVLFSMIHKNEYLRPSAKPVHKFEVISRGKTRTETVFLLSDVQICRPKRVWLHEGRIIKAGQKPVKVERIKPRTLKRTREAKLYEIWANEDDSPHSQQQQGLFTYEQTELYQPPVIVDGVLPRNEYGNFECFKPHMLPLGTVKLRQKGMKSIAKKLGIDCVDLVVGFSFETGGQAHPVFDGVMVCKEYEAELVNTYNIEMEKVRQNQLKEKSDIALNRWRVYLVRLRLHIRLTKQYGSDGDDDKNMDHDVTEDNLANTNHYKNPTDDSEDSLCVVKSTRSNLKCIRNTRTRAIVICSDDDGIENIKRQANLADFKKRKILDQNPFSAEGDFSLNGEESDRSNFDNTGKIEGRESDYSDGGGFIV